MLLISRISYVAAVYENVWYLCLIQDGLSSAALFAEMVVALRDQDEEEASDSASASVTAVTTTTKSPSITTTAIAATTSAVSARPPSISTEKAPAIGDKPTGTKPTNYNLRAAPPPPVLLTAGMASSPLVSPTTTLESYSSSSSSPPWSPVMATAADPFGAKEGGEEGVVQEQQQQLQLQQLQGQVTELQQEVEKKPKQQAQKKFSSVVRRRLKALHERYGEFAEENGYVRCEDREASMRQCFTLFGSICVRMFFFCKRCEITLYCLVIGSTLGAGWGWHVFRVFPFAGFWLLFDEISPNVLCTINLREQSAIWLFNAGILD